MTLSVVKLKTEENLVKLNEVFALLRNVNKLSRILLCQKMHLYSEKICQPMTKN